MFDNIVSIGHDMYDPKGSIHTTYYSEYGIVDWMPDGSIVWSFFSADEVLDTDYDMF